MTDKYAPQAEHWTETAYADPAGYLAHRAELVHAALVIVRHWLASGRPLGTRPLGSFETTAATKTHPSTRYRLAQNCASGPERGFL